jgi:CDP-diacylglycerol--glycerol-3-phosphate 3-phosphatidyltransferase
MTSPSTYGPTAIRTPANLITALRIVATPLVILLVLHDRRSYVPAGIWFVLAMTDGFDGFVARRQGATRSGAFLDPLADKVMVFGAFFGLVYLGRVALLPVVIMALRELGISLYRGVVSRAGVSIPARLLGKIKMVMQLLVIELALLPQVSDLSLIDRLTWVATVLALASGLQYWYDARRRRVSVR